MAQVSPDKTGDRRTGKKATDKRGRNWVSDAYKPGKGHQRPMAASEERRGLD